MARYTIQAPDGRKITIEAGDEQTALRGAKEWAAANPKAKAATSRPFWERTSAALAAIPQKYEAYTQEAAASAKRPLRETIGRPMRNAGPGIGDLLNIPLSAVADVQDALVRPVASALTPQNPLARSPSILEAVRNRSFAPIPQTREQAVDRLTGDIGLALGAAMPGRAAGAVGLSGPVFPARVAAQRAAASRVVRGSAVPLEDLRTAKNAAYKSADQAGVQFQPQAFDQLVQDISARAAADNINPLIHPKASAMLGEIQSRSGQAPTLTELDQLRQAVSRDVASSTDRAERFFGRNMIDEIDRFIDSADQSSLLSGTNPGPLIQNARRLNARTRKVEDVETALRKAELRAASTGSGGNVDNAIRQNLRGVLERGRFSPEETAAFERVIRGTPTQNSIRSLGKLSPQGNGLMAALNLGAAAAAGPVGAIPGILGVGAKAIGDNATRANVANLLRVISAEETTVGQLQALRAQARGSSKVAKFIRDQIDKRLSALQTLPVVGIGGQSAYPPMLSQAAAQEEQPQ